TDFWLSHHVRENFDGRTSALLSPKAEDSDNCDAGQQKNKEEAAEHIQSSWIIVTCWPPLCSRSSRASNSVKRGSRASITRKNPSLVARLNRCQLKIG